MSDLPTSAMGVMRLLQPTKQGIDAFSNQLIAAVKNGDVNPLELRVFLKTMEAIGDKVREHVRENELTEADKWAENKFSAYGVTFEKAELGTRYDYNVCNDPVHDRLLVRVSERTAFLRTIKSPMTIVDDETGEVVTIKPPLKKSTSGLKISFS